MTIELDEFLTTTWDVQNLQYSLKYIDSNQGDLEKAYNELKAQNPTDPIFSRPFDNFKYGLVESLLTARLVLMATAILYYVDPTDTKTIGFETLAGMFKRVCPEYETKIDPNEKELHTMEILMDLRNKSVHKQPVQNYKFIKNSETPMAIMLKNVFVITYGQNDDVYLHGRDETKEQFMQKVTNGSQKHMGKYVVPGVNNKRSYMTFGELLMYDAINCVKDYDARRSDAASPTTRNQTAFF